MTGKFTQTSERRRSMILQILLFLLLGIGVGTFGTLVGIGG